jgi:hypothetical protein
MSLALHLLQSQRVREGEEAELRQGKYKHKENSETPV